MHILIGLEFIASLAPSFRAGPSVLRACLKDLTFLFTEIPTVTSAVFVFILFVLTPFLAHARAPGLTGTLLALLHHFDMWSDGNCSNSSIGALISF
jgi:hypothetical protein